VAPQQTAPDADVIVVGFGPVGATLALLLARSGRNVTIIERQPTLYGLPRAVHIDDGAARVLQAAGLADVLAANSEQTKVYEWRNAEGTTLLRLSSDRKSHDGWPSSNMIHQPTIEAAMAELVEASPLITVYRDEIVTSVREADSHVEVASVDGAGSTLVRSATYVVGCDGANSTVRAQINVPTVDLGYFFDWLIVDVVLNEPRIFEPENLQVCDPLRPTTVVSAGPGRRRWEFMCLPTEDASMMNDSATAWRLLEPWDVRPDNATLERHVVYRFQAMWVEQWRRGRVLLAGDAAHLMPPFAGQGLCSGLKDVSNLAWKIDHLLGTGGSSDHLLDSYQEERTPHVKGAIELSVELGKIICVPDPAAAKARDEAMAPGAAGGAAVAPAPPPVMTTGCIGVGLPLAGRSFPQGLVGTVRSDDAFGRGWKLIGPAGFRSHHEENESDAGWFESIGQTIEIGIDVTFTDQTISEWFTEHNVAVALVRPDSIVYGAVNDIANTNQLTQSLQDYLTHGARS
jgi:flavoprotein hydroxylase